MEYEMDYEMDKFDAPEAIYMKMNSPQQKEYFSPTNSQAVTKSQPSSKPTPTPPSSSWWWSPSSKPTPPPPSIKLSEVKKKAFTNVEPNFDNLVTANLCSTAFKNWIDSNLDKQINSQIVKQFFLSFFALLAQYNSCFERGAFIFQNDTNVLFNILTFDKLKFELSYNCDDPLSEVVATAPVRHPIRPANVHSISTGTHVGPITLRANLISQAGPCVPAKFFLKKGTDRKNHKFERIFDGDLSLDDVCNKCIVKTGEHDHRRVILYYPYVLNTALNYISDVTNNNNRTPESSILNFLFVKFESQPVSGTISQKMAHVGNYASRKISGLFSSTPTPTATTATPTATPTATTATPTPTLDERREDDPLTVYSTILNNGFTQKAKDINFYTSLGLPTKTLEWYNDNVRIGQEFFVSQKLLEYLLMNYLFTNYVCPGKGGKRKTRQKRNKTRNKRTQKRHKKNKKIFTRKRYN